MPALRIPREPQSGIETGVEWARLKVGRGGIGEEFLQNVSENNFVAAGGDDYFVHAAAGRAAFFAGG